MQALWSLVLVLVGLILNVVLYSDKSQSVQYSEERSLLQIISWIVPSM